MWIEGIFFARGQPMWLPSINCPIYFYLYILFMVLFLLSKNVASLAIGQTVTFFSSTIFYKKGFKIYKAFVYHWDGLIK